MDSQFPPSSPIASSHQYDLQNPFYQPEKDADGVHSSPTLRLFKNKDETKKEPRKDYPTPHPSSTTGRSSSPVRGLVDEIASSDYEIERQLETELKKVNLIDITLDPRDSSRLCIGRKKSVCDIHLPRAKNISRQHAFISYISESNEIKLECNGTNGLVVSFPRKLSHVLIKRLKSSNVYELVTNDKVGNGVAVTSEEKELLKSTYLTSFVLLKGESVIMPYMKDTIIDFRRCEGRLRLQDVTTDEEDAANATETEDEAERTEVHLGDLNDNENKFVFHSGDSKKTIIPLKEIERSPPTPKCKVPSVSPIAIRNSTLSNPSNVEKTEEKTEEKPTMTPYSSFTLKTPTAPKKVETIKLLESNSTPINRKSGEISDENRRRKLNTPSPKKKLKKKSRKQNTHEELSSEDILAGLTAKGIDYRELQHVLANHLAFSNIQQVPLFQLQDVNSTISNLSRTQLRAILNDEQCIGVIYRTGKDAAGKPLDEEYYYDMENDPDNDRRQLVASLKGGRSGLRSCRRVHKQYFWKKPAK
ncbi:protein PLM2 [Kluyveromyces marxianus]|uniref:Protein PLM2 n=1 Tax=Kluyveromyces marxianus TaxID=4911 RepID=A0ABX6EV34_KLUMA|nr:protein PLM2 [Kluyveromyces marxianus]